MPRPDEKRERARNAILALIIVVTLVCGGVGIAFWAMKRSRNIATEDIRTKVGSLTKVKAPQGEYIGSKACEECHQEEYDLYQTHPKAQSFVAYRDAKRIESGEQQKAFDIGSYLFEANQYETEMTHHEKVKVGDKIAYELVRTMDYVLGSGKRERNYITNTGGILLQSPISWRTDEQKWWVCSDFDAESHLNFSRRIGDNCLFCHSGRPNPDGAGSDRFLKPAFHETAIGCERCHGPGKAHLDKQRANPTPGQPDDSIVNPANLSPAQRDHVCHQCHVRSTHVIPRYGANLFDFRPGGFIDDVVVTFVAEPESDLHWQLADQSRQMQSSKCFIASAGKLGCITCHGAHSVPAEEEKSAYYMAKCNSCHAEQGCALSENLRNKAPANGDCAKCHMPRLPQNNIPHIPITDHRIRRFATVVPVDPNVELPPEAIAFDNAELRLPPRALERGRGLSLLLDAMNSDPSTAAATASRGAMLLVPPPIQIEEGVEIFKHDIPVMNSLGTTFAMVGREDLAKRCWSYVLSADPNNEISIEWLSRVAFQDQRDEEVLQHCERLLKLNPNSATAHLRRVLSLARLSRREDAIEAANQAVALNPSLLQVHQWLADTYELIGDETKAEREKEIVDLLKDAGIE